MIFRRISFFVSLNDSWEKVPMGIELEEQLRCWGVFDPRLTEVALQERWVRFAELDFGVIPHELHA